MKKEPINIGEAKISEEAIAQLAGSVAVECFGVIGMAAVSVTDGLVRLITREFLRKGVEITVRGDSVDVAFHIIVAYGVSIQAVTENLVETVTYKLENYTGLKVGHVSIFVEGVKPID